MVGLIFGLFFGLGLYTGKLLSARSDVTPTVGALVDVAVRAIPLLALGLFLRPELTPLLTRSGLRGGRWRSAVTVRDRTRSLYPPIAMHFVWNAAWTLWLW